VLLDRIVPTELRAPLPPILQGPQAVERDRYLALTALLANLSPTDQDTLHAVLGHGFDF
jgi:hypothetical protein